MPELYENLGRPTREISVRAPKAGDSNAAGATATMSQ